MQCSETPNNGTNLIKVFSCMFEISNGSGSGSWSHIHRITIQYYSRIMRVGVEFLTRYGTNLQARVIGQL